MMRSKRMRLIGLAASKAAPPCSAGKICDKKVLYCSYDGVIEGMAVAPYMKGVPSMIDVIDMIPSKDMRDALRKSGREFTDMEKATIIHNLGLPPLRRRGLLEELLGETEDEGLREQLQYSLADEEYLIARFREVAEGCVFGASVYDEGAREVDSVDAYFSTFSAAFEYGSSSACAFRIQKWHVHSVAPGGEWWENDGDCGWMEFDKNGQMTESSLWHEDDEADRPQFAPDIIAGKRWPHYLYFEDRWVSLPNLYRLGDIVRVLGGKASYIEPAFDWAVVNVENDGDEWTALDERATKELQAIEAGTLKPQGLVPDYSDVQLTVEFPCKGGTFVHDHINPLFLERMTEDAPEGSAEAKLREMATWAVRGECSLEYTSDVLKENILAAQAIQPSRCF